MSRSVPAFPFDFSTEPVTLFVVGSAPCLAADLDVAKGLRPSHKIMAINYTACWIKADFVFSIHVEDMPIFREGQLKFGPDFSTHADMRRTGRGRADYMWRGSFYSATSAIAGASVGRMMGFPEVILCGAPMDGPAAYYQPQPGLKTKPQGSVSKIVKSHLRGLERFATMAKGRVFSLSGFSRQVLGPPPEVPVYGH